MKNILTSILILLSLNLLAQEENKISINQNPYQEIQQLAADHNYDKAKDLARIVLEEDTMNFDVKILLARIYAWESNYDSAFSIIEQVSHWHPDYPDAIFLKADIFYWKNDWKALYDVSGSAEEMGLGNPTIKYYRALSAYYLGYRDEAEAVIETILNDDPDYEQALKLRTQILLNSESAEVYAQYYLDHFTQPYNRRWQMFTVGGNIPFSKGTISPSVNGGHLMDGGNSFVTSSALQLNADAYYLFSEKNYLLAGYGISNGTYFPRHRLVLNVWQILPKGWAVSAGGRYFYWDQHFAFLTLGGEKYLGNYWINLNNSIFIKDYGVSVSSYLTARRYMEHKLNHLSLTIGYGTSPDEPLSSITDLQRLNALSLRLALSRQVQQKLRISIGTGYLYEEFLKDEFRHRMDVSIGLHYKID